VVPHLEWPGAAQVARIERIRETGGKVGTEIAYIVSSLAGAGPERLLELSRNHWAIENRLHYVRDVSFNEDRCRVRAGARALAAIRNLVLYLIRSQGMSVPRPLPPSRGGFIEWPCTAHVSIDIGGTTITASIANEAVDELGLKLGVKASAVIKSSDAIAGVE